MNMEHLPKVAEKHIKEQFQTLNQSIVAGQLQRWLDGELNALHEKNPVLYHFITERANKFAMGASAVGDPQAIAISMALEYVMLLRVLNASISDFIGLQKFTDMMKGLLGKEDLKGLNNFGNGNEQT